MTSGNITRNESAINDLIGAVRNISAEARQINAPISTHEGFGGVGGADGINKVKERLSSSLAPTPAKTAGLADSFAQALEQALRNTENDEAEIVAILNQYGQVADETPTQVASSSSPRSSSAPAPKQGAKQPWVIGK